MNCVLTFVDGFLFCFGGEKFLFGGGAFQQKTPVFETDSTKKSSFFVGSVSFWIKNVPARREPVQKQVMQHCK